MSGKTPLSVKLEDEMKQQLKQLSEIKQRSVHWMVRQAIRQYIEREVAVEAFGDETREALNDIEAGRTVSHEAVGQWLKSWGSENEKEPPLCGE